MGRKKRTRGWVLRRALRHEMLESRSLLAGMTGDSPWQNPFDDMDVNCDGNVTAADAMVTINALNSGDGGNLSQHMAPPGLLGRVVGAATGFVDSTGDGQLTAKDALNVINALNAGLHVGSPNNLPPTDQQPDAPGPDAQVIDLSNGFGKVRAAINTDGDVDVFQVTPTKAQLNVALFSGGQAMTVSVVDGAGTELGAASADAGVHRPARVNVDVQAGTTYFLVVKGAAGVTGTYSLSVLNFTGDDFTPQTDSPLGTDIHGDTPATATTLTLDHGHATVISNIDAAGDVDMFQIAAIDGKLAVTAGAKFPLSVQISDSTGKVLGSITSSDGSVLAINVTAGNYFVTIAAANGTDTGAYHVNVTNTSLPVGSGDDHDDDNEPSDHPGLPTPQDLFIKIDTSGNSAISLDEFKAGVPFGGTRFADRVFANLDTNGDGSLSLDEFIAGLAKLHLRGPEHHGDDDSGAAGPLVTHD